MKAMKLTNSGSPFILTFAVYAPKIQAIYKG